MDSDVSGKGKRNNLSFQKMHPCHYEGYKINVVDTSGACGFWWGKYRRILKMVDSVLLLVDAFEGVMPQTKYVLKQALEHGLKPIVVINKIDRPNSDPDGVVDTVFDLFVDLGAMIFSWISLWYMLQLKTVLQKSILKMKTRT